MISGQRQLVVKTCHRLTSWISRSAPFYSVYDTVGPSTAGTIKMEKNFDFDGAELEVDTVS